MPSNHRQIIAFRRPVSIGYIFDPYRNAGWSMSNMRGLACAIRMALEANEHWSDCENVLETILNVYTPRKGGNWGPDRFEEARALRAVEYGARFQVELCAEQLSLVPKPGVIMRVFQGYIDQTKTPSFTLSFNDAAEGARVMEALGKLEYLGFKEANWEPAIYLKPWIADHWVFSQGSEARLGARLTKIHKPGGYFQSQGDFGYCRLAPLPGETLVVYPGTAINALGFNPPHDRKAPQHPDPLVFATVGPFSLAFKKGESQNGRHGYDRVVVFEDSRLPIAPPEEDERQYYFADIHDYDDTPDGWYSDDD